jgi:ATP-dependent exoDNAse (exonuclease V) beta subunit
MKFNHVKLEGVVPKLQQVNEGGTRYYVTPEGNKYPSITTVLSAYNIKEIMEWRRRVGDEEANKISRQASSRGTRIHTLCEQYLDNKELTFKTPLDTETFNRFKPVLHRINNIYAQEIRMYSDHLRIAGTVDCVAEFDGKLSIIDFKTSKRLKKEEDIENYFMQVSGYAVMFEERFGIPVNRVVVAIAVDDEDPQVFIAKRDTYISNLLNFRDLYERKSGFSIAMPV